ncbi:hypothetical protein R3P38DRAFT_2797102 [Favolaschia claudopus]|uniref:Uncharacterized protein n=1 Tax=Favolaschia claudopus TaxID=2862362 RepID=A0AAW0A2X9_9AGAR
MPLSLSGSRMGRLSPASSSSSSKSRASIRISLASLERLRQDVQRSVIVVPSPSTGSNTVHGLQALILIYLPNLFHSVVERDSTASSPPACHVIVCMRERAEKATGGRGAYFQKAFGKEGPGNAAASARVKERWEREGEETGCTSDERGRDAGSGRCGASCTHQPEIVAEGKIEAADREGEVEVPWSSYALGCDEREETLTKPRGSKYVAMWSSSHSRGRRYARKRTMPSEDLASTYFISHCHLNSIVWRVNSEPQDARMALARSIGKVGEVGETDVMAVSAGLTKDLEGRQ